MTEQAHRINIEAGQQSVFEALSTAGGWSRWFTPEVTGDFTEQPGTGNPQGAS